MNRAARTLLVLLLAILAGKGAAASKTFDQAQWHTGDMNEQSPSDSAGNTANSHVDYFYYYERIPMRMAVLDDSLANGSASRTYDSAILALVVAANGLSGNDSMRVFGRRLTRNWSESGVSWTYYWASPDSAWSTAGGDVNTLRCMDTIIVDASAAVYTTLLLHLDTGFVRYMVETANYGWLMMATNLVDRGSFQFFTEDIGTVAYRPVLTVYYTDHAAGGLASRRRHAAGGLP